MLETRFSEVLNPDNELLRAAKLINWDKAPLGFIFVLKSRRQLHHLMMGIHILKHHDNVSDEAAVHMLHENAYWQAFRGYKTFQYGEVLDSSILSEVQKPDRDRVEEEERGSLFCHMEKDWSREDETGDRRYHIVAEGHHLSNVCRSSVQSKEEDRENC